MIADALGTPGIALILIGDDSERFLFLDHFLQLPQLHAKYDCINEALWLAVHRVQELYNMWD